MNDIKNMIKYRKDICLFLIEANEWH